jgi:hypothetical protein
MPVRDLRLRQWGGFDYSRLYLSFGLAAYYNRPCWLRLPKALFCTYCSSRA